MMKEVLRSLYQILIPKSFRQRIHAMRFRRYLERLKHEIIEYYSNPARDGVTDEERRIVAYLETNPISVFPYSFQDKYSAKEINVFEDETTGLQYVLFEGKRLYFKREWETKHIQKYYRQLKMEQDIDSPHRYLTENFTVDTDDVVVDIGSAEGNFSLSVVEKVNRLFLFEASEDWIEALNATFKPWKDKVEIIHKYVSNKDESNCVTLDSFFSDDQRIDFIKIDVEMNEADVLEGCDSILKDDGPLKIALCTYHTQDAEQKFGRLLEEKGFTISTSKGFMIFIHGGKLYPPYLRRGLIRASKETNPH